MSNIAHIGLGKTATTTLQKTVFPKIASDLGYIFNDAKIVNILRKHKFYPLSADEISDFNQIMSRNNNIISFESLIPWNPALWEQAGQKNLELLGKETKILITLRDPRSWMTSVYQQQVHSGNVIKPEHFFLSEDEYRRAQFVQKPNHCEYLCPDHVDFEKLLEIYSKRFDAVECVSMHKLGGMEFLTPLLPIAHDYVSELRKVYASSKVENKGYSQAAMKLTFAREAFLRSIGLKSYGTNDRRFEDLGRYVRAPANKRGARYSDLSFYRRSLRSFGKVIRILGKLIRFPNWRRLMQDYFDKLYPYKKYQLPSSIDLNERQIKENLCFINALKFK